MHTYTVCNCIRNLVESM